MSDDSEQCECVVVSGWLVGWWTDSKPNRVGKPDWLFCLYCPEREVVAVSAAVRGDTCL